MAAALRARWSLVKTAGAGASLILGSVAANTTLTEGEPEQVIDGHRYRLVNLQAVFRHGARTPLHALPGVPEVIWEAELCRRFPDRERALRITGLDGSPRPVGHMDAKQVRTFLPGGCPMGSLTVQGRKEAHELGLYLKQRYGWFVSDYDPQSVFVRSTNVTRTIETCRVVLTGWFGEMGRHIHMVTTADENEVVYPNTTHCARLGELMRIGSKAFAKHEHALAIVQRLSEVLNVPHKDVKLVGIRDSLVSRMAHGKEIPSHITEEAIREADRGAAFLMREVFMSGNEELAVLASGSLLHELLERLRQVKAGKNVPRLSVYSGHDTTLIPLLLIFDAFDGKWPPFASHIEIELLQDAEGHSSSGELFVRVRYNKHDCEMPQACGGGVLCPLDTFLEHLTRFELRPDQRATACMPHGASHSREKVMSGDGS
eukprot:m.6366 g.6366  ORF g.6366 m.6366 type:complete len:430 (+) comp2614_c0_seq1:61-1350(+)